MAGLLPQGQSVLDHLEGVGRGFAYSGPSLPYIAVPSTAGTGSEMTKNAVLSDNEQGFKKSFRDEQLTAQVAIIDPQLLASCPRSQLVANAMDAFTQLLESYTSPRSNPITDALALSGIEYFLQGFSQHCEADLAGHDYLAYASMISGICLAQTGLGAVHGMASPLGAHFPIPHGVACGTTLAMVTQTNITALKARQPDSIALSRYAQVGRLLVKQPELDQESALAALQNTLTRWTKTLALPTLSHYGMTASDVELIVKESGGNSMKTNPLVLTEQELTQILLARL
jgi:alcohol dehydrogenase